MIKKFSNKLPTILQTDTQKEFFSATFDQLFSPAEVEQAQGFIGRKSSAVFNPGVDNYLQEPTKLRAAYQLEPIAYAVNTALEDTNEVFYEDLINYLEFRGGDVGNHDRLFADTYYSFAPPIDVDKYLNFQNYLWLEDGGPIIYVQYAGALGGAEFDSIIETQIIGATQFNTSENADLRPRGLDLSSGMRIRFEGSSSYDRPLWIEGVGREIRLVEELTSQISGDTITTRLFDNSIIADSGAGSGYQIAITSLDGIADGGLTYTASDVLTVVHTHGVDGEITAATITVDTVDGSGTITGATLTTGGDYYFGDQNPITVTGGTGSGATFNVTFEGELVTVSGGTFTVAATLRPTEVSAGGSVVQAEIISRGTYSVFPAPPASTTSAGSGTGLQVNLYENGDTGELWDNSITEEGFDRTVESDLSLSDYLTIERGSCEGSPWARTNRWYNVDIVNTAQQLGQIIDAAIVDGGINYSVGDQLPVDGDGINGIITVTSVDGSGTITGIRVSGRGQGYTFGGVDQTGSQGTTDTVLWDATDPTPNPSGESWDTSFLWDEVISGSAIGQDAVISITLASATDRSTKAERPILEFRRDLQLRDFGNKYITEVDVVADNELFADVETQPEGTEVDGVVLKDGMRLIFLDPSQIPNFFEWDETPDSGNPGASYWDTFAWEAEGASGSVSRYIWEIQITSGQISLIKVDPITGLASAGADPVPEGGVVLATQGVEFAGRSFYQYRDPIDNEYTWLEAQQKTGVNIAPLYELYDINGVRLDDEIEYEGSDFAGNELFSYRILTAADLTDTDGSLTADSVLGFPLTLTGLRQISDIVFENDLETNRVTYDEGEIPGYYFYKEWDADPYCNIRVDADLVQLSEFKTNWSASPEVERQRVIDKFLTEDDTQDKFTISATPRSNTERFDIRINEGRRLNTDEFAYIESTGQVQLFAKPTDTGFEIADGADSVYSFAGIVDPAEVYVNNFYEERGLDYNVINSVQLSEVEVTALAGGSGYAVSDELTIVGGVADRTAKVRVVSVDIGGAVTGVFVSDVGVYLEAPSTTVSTTGGTGTGCFLDTVFADATGNTFTIQFTETDGVTPRAIDAGAFIEAREQGSGAPGANQIVEIIYSTLEDITDDDIGFFEIPAGLENNPNNVEVLEQSWNDFTPHMVSIIENQSRYLGTAFGSVNNYRDTSKDASQGEYILQTQAPLLKTMLATSSNELDIIEALRFSGKEYARYKNKFVKEAKNLIDQGFTPFDDGDDIPVDQWVDECIRRIIRSREFSTAFEDTYMLAYSNTYQEESYDFVSEVVTGASTSRSFNTVSNFVDLADKRNTMYVYVNGIIQRLDVDYTISNLNPIEITWINVPTGTFTITIRLYEDMGPSHIPATPQKLGLAPIFQPRVLFDDSYQTPLQVLVNHDGSRTPLYNDYRDDLMYEFETRIYNGILEQFRVEYDLPVQEDDYKPGKYRSTRWDTVEWNKLLRANFFKWVAAARADYITNEFYDAANTWTWNYSEIVDGDGDTLPGNWRGIFDLYYDTQTPQSTPWEMLGFTNEPSWWETEYGAAPYQSTNPMWADLEAGTIKLGWRAGTDTRYARPGLTSNSIPVDVDGNLRATPLLCIANDGSILEPTTVQAAKGWQYGDLSPVEYAWRIGETYSFAVSEALFLARPGEYGEKFWDPEHTFTIPANTLQIVSDDSDVYKRVGNDTLTVHGETISGIKQVNTGWQVWVSSRLRALGKDLGNDFGQLVRTLDVKLGHKMASFTNKDTMSLTVEGISVTSQANNLLVPQENINVSLHTSPPVREYVYGGVLIRAQADGTFQLFGYDILNGEFNYIPRIDNHPQNSNVNVGGTPEQFTTWQANTTYNANAVVRFNTLYYRAIETHTSSTFDTSQWAKLGSLPSTGGINVTYKPNGIPNVVEQIQYGAQINTAQELFDIIIGYGDWLVSEGWVFEQINPESGTPETWLSAAKQFLLWTQSDWEAGSIVMISPAATGAKLVVSEGYPAAVEKITNGVYSILDKNGVVIDPRNTVIKRNGREILVSPVISQVALFGARINTTETESIITLDNITDFNDVIYDPLLGSRLARVSFNGRRTTGWTGKLEAGGYIITEDRLIPNFENMVNSIRYYHDTESTLDNPSIENAARHLIGFDERTYYDDLDIQNDAQFQFYQGAIRQKGTVQSIRRLERSARIGDATQDTEVFEEWALRTNDFGNICGNQTVEFFIQANEVRVDPQLVQLSYPASNTEGERTYFDDTDIASDTITIANHGYTDGDLAIYKTYSGATAQSFDVTVGDYGGNTHGFTLYGTNAGSVSPYRAIVTVEDGKKIEFVEMTFYDDGGTGGLEVFWDRQNPENFIFGDPPVDADAELLFTTFQYINIGHSGGTAVIDLRDIGAGGDLLISSSNEGGYADFWFPNITKLWGAGDIGLTYPVSFIGTGQASITTLTDNTIYSIKVIDENNIQIATVSDPSTELSLDNASGTFSLQKPINGVVSSIDIVSNTNTIYTSVPNVTIENHPDDTQGIGASAIAILDSDSTLLRIDVLNTGYGYIYPPTVYIGDTVIDDTDDRAVAILAYDIVEDVMTDDVITIDVDDNVRWPTKPVGTACSENSVLWPTVAEKQAYTLPNSGNVSILDTNFSFVSTAGLDTFATTASPPSEKGETINVAYGENESWAVYVLNNLRSQVANLRIERQIASDDAIYAEGRIVLSDNLSSIGEDNALESAILTYSTSAGAVSNVTVTNSGYGYWNSDTITISGSSGTPAVIPTTSINGSLALNVGQNTILSQTNVNFTGVGEQGTFSAGTGYAGLDTLTLEDGTVIQVDTADGGTGAVLTFTIITASTTAFNTIGTLKQASTSGSGVGFSLTVGGANVELDAPLGTGYGAATDELVSSTDIPGPTQSGRYLSNTANAGTGVLYANNILYDYAYSGAQTVSAVESVGRGVGYAPGDELSANGGFTLNSPATITVDSIRTIAGQTQTSFDAASPNGSFVGGAGYSAARNTFSVVDDTENTITTTADHGYTTGDSVVLREGTTLPTGLADNTVYYVISVNDDTIRLATSADNALAGIAVSFTGAGAGTHSLSDTIVLDDSTLIAVNTIAGSTILAQGHADYTGGSPNGTFTAGTGYAPGNTITLTDNTVITVVDVSTSVRLIANQTETDYTASFVGGTGYVVNEIIELSDGAIVTVNGVAGGGVVDAFTVTSTGDTGTAPSTLRTQNSTSGSGTSFTLTPDLDNEELFGDVTQFTISTVGDVVNITGIAVAQSTTNANGTGFSITPDTANVDIAAGVVGEFTIDTAGNALTSSGTTQRQAQTTDVGTGFELVLGTNNEEILDVTQTTGGDYSVLPGVITSDHTNIAFDATNDTITVSGGTSLITLGFGIGQTIAIGNAEDEVNDGEYIIASLTDTVITVSNNVPLTNATNSAATLTTASTSIVTVNGGAGTGATFSLEEFRPLYDITKDGTAVADATFADDTVFFILSNIRYYGETVRDTFQFADIAAGVRTVWIDNNTEGLWEVQNLTLPIVANQTQADYDGGWTQGRGDHGTFTGGSNHVASDVITLTDGSTILVDTVSGTGGVVTGFTVLSKSTTNVQFGDIIEQASTTGNGVAFSITVDSHNILPVDITIDATSLAFDSTANTITATGGTDLLLLGFIAGQTINVSNAADAGNNGTYTISTVTGSVISTVESITTTNAADTVALITVTSDTIAYTQREVQDTLIDTEKFKQAFVYEEDTGDTIVQLPVYDPFKGLIPGAADVNIAWKTRNDPARYNNAANDRLLSDTRVFDSEQLGKLWWDLSTCAYLYYEQGTDTYRRDNWGALIEGSSIDIYEWTRSTAPPANYEGNGTVRSTTEYTQAREYDRQLEETRTFYYFWVKDRTVVPEGVERTLAGFEVARLLTNPTAQQFRWFSPVSQTGFVFAGVEGSFTDSDNIVQINYRRTEDEEPRHVEWQLGRENDPDYDILPRHWDKAVDSLCGFTDLVDIGSNANTDNIAEFLTQSGVVSGTDVITTNAAHGFATGDGVTYSINSGVDTVGLTDGVMYYVNVASSTTLTLHATVTDAVGAASAIDLTSAGTNETHTLTQKTTALNNFRTALPSASDNTKGYLIVPDPTLSNTERYGIKTRPLQSMFVDRDEARRIFVDKVNELMEFVNLRDENSTWNINMSTNTLWQWSDWYAEGYDETNTIPVYQVDSTSDLDSITQIIDKDIVRVTGTRWRLFEYGEEDDVFTLVGREASRLELLDTIYTNDESLADAIELRELITALIDNVFITDRAINKNLVFFALLNYVFSEQDDIDWVFKTTYVFLKQQGRTLTQERVYQNDPFDAALDFIEEFKPYQTKIRDFRTERAAELDLVPGTAEELVRDFTIDMRYDRLRGGDLSVEEMRVAKNEIAQSNRWDGYTTKDAGDTLVRLGAAGRYLASQDLSDIADIDSDILEAYTTAPSPAIITFDVTAGGALDIGSVTVTVPGQGYYAGGSFIITPASGAGGNSDGILTYSVDTVTGKGTIASSSIIGVGSGYTPGSGYTVAAVDMPSTTSQTVTTDELSAVALINTAITDTFAWDYEGLFIQNTEFTGNPSLISATIATAGTGYVTGDLLSLDAGSGIPISNAQFRVTSVDGGNGVTGLQLVNGGSYQQTPTVDPVDLLGGSGSGAQVTDLIFESGSTVPYDSTPHDQIGWDSSVFDPSVSPLEGTPLDLYRTIPNQTNINFDGGTGEGTVFGGTGHAPADVITMNDGSEVTVYAAPAGVVTQFEITKGSTTSNMTEATLIQTSTTGTGVLFSLTLGTANQSSANFFDVPPEETFNGTGSVQEFTLTTTVPTVFLFVVVDDVELRRNVDYFFLADELFFLTAPAAGTNNIQVYTYIEAGELINPQVSEGITEELVPLDPRENLVIRADTRAQGSTILSGVGLQFTNGSPSTITRQDAASFVGITAGEFIYISGSDDNNGYYFVAALTQVGVNPDDTIELLPGVALTTETGETDPGQNILNAIYVSFTIHEDTQQGVNYWRNNNSASTTLTADILEDAETIPVADYAPLDVAPSWDNPVEAWIGTELIQYHEAQTTSTVDTVVLNNAGSGYVAGDIGEVETLVGGNGIPMTIEITGVGGGGGTNDQTVTITTVTNPSAGTYGMQTGNGVPNPFDLILPINPDGTGGNTAAYRIDQILTFSGGGGGLEIYMSRPAGSTPFFSDFECFGDIEFQNTAGTVTLSTADTGSGGDLDQGSSSDTYLYFPGVTPSTIWDGTDVGNNRTVTFKPPTVGTGISTFTIASGGSYTTLPSNDSAITDVNTTGAGATFDITASTVTGSLLQSVRRGYKGTHPQQHSNGDKVFSAQTPQLLPSPEQVWANAVTLADYNGSAGQWRFVGEDVSERSVIHFSDTAANAFNANVTVGEALVINDTDLGFEYLVTDIINTTELGIVTITAAGTGYEVGDVIDIDSVATAGAGVTAEVGGVDVNGGIVYVRITNRGTGYTDVGAVAVSNTEITSTNGAGATMNAFFDTEGLVCALPNRILDVNGIIAERDTLTWQVNSLRYSLADSSNTDVNAVFLQAGPGNAL